MLTAIKDLHIGCCIDEAGRAGSVAFGLSLASAARAHVTVQVVSAKLVVPGAFLSGAGAAVIEQENARKRAAAEAAEETIRKEAAAQGTPCTTAIVHLPSPDAIAAFGRQSRLHDLTILNAEPVGLSLERALANEVLFTCGRPVLLVPKDREAFRLDHAIVAWDGSSQAARALNDALPLLSAARSVSLVSVAETGKDDMLPGAEIVPHLARHGIDATLVTLEPGSHGVEGALRGHAHAHRTDLVVMGAYAHSWWRELVLGGVTESFLGDPPAPLLLSR